MDTKNCKGCEIEFTYDSNIKSDKTKKFCTKQCCKKYYRSLSKQKSKKANGWVPNRKTRKEKQLIEKNIYLELNKTHLKIKDIEEKYNITFNAFEKFCKKYIGVTLEAIIVKVSFYNGHWGGGITKFYKQDIIPYIEKYTSNKIPDGFVDTSYIIEKLNICKITYWEYVKLFGSVEGKCLYLNRPIYPKPSADLWIEKIPVLRKELSESSNLKKKLEILERNKIKKQLQQEKTNKWKLEIQERRKRERKEIEARKLARSLIAKKQRYPNRQDDWTSWQNYESRLRARLSDTSELSKIRSQKSINANKHYHEQHDLGNIINLSCKRCNIQKPYYDFLFSQSIKIGRSQPCKECARKAANKNKNVNKLKDENQFSIQFIVSIKRELSKKNGCYYEIPAKNCSLV